MRARSTIYRFALPLLLAAGCSSDPPGPQRANHHGTSSAAASAPLTRDAPGPAPQLDDRQVVEAIQRVAVQILPPDFEFRGTLRIDRPQPAAPGVWLYHVRGEITRTEFRDAPYFAGRVTQPWSANAHYTPAAGRWQLVTLFVAGDRLQDHDRGPWIDAAVQALLDRRDGSP